MLTRPRFSLRTGVTCFLVASFWLGLQFPKHYAKGLAYSSVYGPPSNLITTTHGWPMAVTSANGIAFIKPPEAHITHEDFKADIERNQGCPVEYVEGLGYAVTREGTVSYLGALVNVGCAALTALLCAWLTGLILDRKNQVSGATDFG